MQTKNNFLDTFRLIGENQAEYGIMSSMYNSCKNKIFLFEIDNLNKIITNYQNVVKYINDNYKSYEVRVFSLMDAQPLSTEIVFSCAGTSVKDEELLNWAIRRTQINGSFILLRANSMFVLLHNGILDPEFRNAFADKQRMLEADSRRYTIDQLGEVFDRFHIHRVHNGCDYVINGKVSNSISEHQLRENLFNYLYKEAQPHVFREFCTNSEQDEESVDISLVDNNGMVAIIEVKYFIQKGLFEDETKSAYSSNRFVDGYKQLNKYCIHLNHDNYRLHSAYLYMFYAHSKNNEEIMSEAKQHLDNFMSTSDCSDHFKHHYKQTYCDDILAQKNVI